MRISYFLVSTFAFLTNAHADTVKIMGQNLEIVEYGISKSTSARIVNIFSSSPLEDASTKVKGVYIPAGTKLAILNYNYVDKSGRTWKLASTQDGILAFIKSKNKYSQYNSSEYFASDNLKNMLEGTDYKAVAISLSNTVINSKSYGDITLTPSEVYVVTDTDTPGNEVSILIDKRKMGNSWTEDEIVAAPSDAFAVVGIDDFEKSPDLTMPFSEYDAAAEAKNAVISALKEKDIPSFEEVQKKVSLYLDNKFVTQKECESEINYSLDIVGEFAVDVSTFLSPVSAKLALSGKATGSTTYERGAEFDILRIKRKNVIYEVRKDIIRDSCSVSPSAIRTSIGGSDKTEGEITGGDIVAAGVSDSSNGALVYHCRQEYFALVDILVNKNSLPTPISNFVVANFGEFKGAKDPAVCSK